MVELTPVFVLAIIFGAVVALSYIKNRRKEREMLIEKGADASIFYNKNGRFGYPCLKWGIFLAGVAAGLLAGNLLEATTSIRPEVAYSSMVFLLGGSGLIIYYFIERKQREGRGE